MARKLDVEELKHFARAQGLSIAPAEQEEFKALADALIDILDALESSGGGARLRLLEAVRDAGRPPEPAEDPYNAIVRWCRVEADHSGILAGKRIALKDSIGVAGIPLTCGSRVLSGFVPATDSIVAERILKAGGEIVAMTNMDDFALSAGGESSFYGPTLNPFDVSRTAGGSSGGVGCGTSLRPCRHQRRLRSGRIDSGAGRMVRRDRAQADSQPCPIHGHRRNRPDIRSRRSDGSIDRGRRSVASSNRRQGRCGPETARCPCARLRESNHGDTRRAVGVTLGVVTEAFSEEDRSAAGRRRGVEGTVDRFAELGARSADFDPGASARRRGILRHSDSRNDESARKRRKRLRLDRALLDRAAGRTRIRPSRAMRTIFPLRSRSTRSSAPTSKRSTPGRSTPRRRTFVRCW